MLNERDKLGRYLPRDGVRNRRAIAVYPDAEQYERIKQYAEQHDISMGNALLALIKD